MENLDFGQISQGQLSFEWQSEIGPSVYNKNNFIGFEAKIFMKMKIGCFFLTFYTYSLGCDL